MRRKVPGSQSIKDRVHSIMFLDLWCFYQIWLDFITFFFIIIIFYNVASVRSSELLAKLQLEDLDLILRERRLRWFGHVARWSGAIRTAYDMQIDGKRGAGRPKQTWKKLTEKDCREWKLTTVDPQGAPGDQV